MLLVATSPLALASPIKPHSRISHNTCNTLHHTKMWTDGHDDAVANSPDGATLVFWTKYNDDKIGPSD